MRSRGRGILSAVERLAGEGDIVADLGRPFVEVLFADAGFAKERLVDFRPGADLAKLFSG